MCLVRDKNDEVMLAIESHSSLSCPMELVVFVAMFNGISRAIEVSIIPLFKLKLIPKSFGISSWEDYIYE